MLAYISLGIGLCNIVAVCVFFLAWFELHDHLKNSIALQEDFQAAVRRLMISVGFFGMPALEYLFAGDKRSAKIPESYVLAWAVGCALSLLILVHGLVTLIRHADGERKTGSHRYRR